MKRWMGWVVFALLAWTACAGATDVRKTAEASMLVTGWIDVAPNGSVHDYTIDRVENVPSAVTDLIKKSVVGWKFHFDEPVDAMQRTKMYLRIKATPVDDQHESIAISGATFGDGGDAATDHVRYKDRQPPSYPHDAVESRVSGTVYLVVRVNRQGTVENVAAEQVNLNSYGRESQMRHFRDMLADASIEAAKKWTFKLPTTGKHTADPYWDVRVPVAYNLNVMGAPKQDTYGKWQVYIPGPRELVPWLKAEASMTSSPDTIPAGSISQANTSLHLTTALDGA
ncbi:energy transducer TonB [Dyella monticola]|nr:energy transducer TonB [Dyella monticola]